MPDTLAVRFAKASLLKKILVSIFGASVARVVLGWVRRKVLGRPPQPLTMPMLGNLYLLPQPGELPGVHKAMTKLAKTYGPVMGFWFGSQFTVVLSTWEAVYEALKLRGDDFAGRACPPSLHCITKGAGIAMQNDIEKWRKARNFLLMGMTRKLEGDKTVPLIMEEVEATGLEWLKMCQKDASGSATCLTRAMFGRESLNVYMRQMCNIRFSDELTPVYHDVRDCLEKIFERISGGNPADFMPILKLAGKPKVLTEMEHYSDKMYGHIRRWLTEHKQTLDASKPRDFTDEMLLKQKEVGLTDTDIEVIMWDVMAGGIDTTATTMEWLFYILCNYPETQKKIHEELDRVVGPDRLPRYDEYEKLPYLNAVILELMRWKHFAPFGLPHQTLADTECLGYKIPKGAQVMINWHAMGFDERVWKRAEEWRPERWLEEEKWLDQAFINGEVKKTKESYKFIPFGIGKRMCVGWGLGRVVLWCKIATHLHCFDLESGNGQKLNIDDEYFGVTILPNEQQVKFTPRPASRLLRSIAQSGTFAGQSL